MEVRCAIPVKLDVDSDDAALLYEQLLELVSEITAEQGSAIEDVVVSDYLSPQWRRSLCQENMANTLKSAFEPTQL